MKGTKHFIAENNIITPVVLPEGLIIEKIPAGIYTVKVSKNGFYLEFTKDNFDQPEKLYGTIVPRSKRIQHAYNERKDSTGVLFTGLKGSGKSLLMKEISNTMIKQGLPVLIIQENFSGPTFMSFMELVGECVVLLDEFGKTYKRSNKDDQNEQHSLLTFFDGVYSTKRLILMAENKTWDISELFLDRPSRILFHWEYDRLEEEVVDGYCNDNLENTNLKSKIISVYRVSKNFTFDSLQAIVAQCNMFKDYEFKEVINGLNIPLGSKREEVVISLKIDGKERRNRIKDFWIEDHMNAYRLFVYRTKDNKEASQVDSMYINEDAFVSRKNDISTYKFDFNEKKVIAIIQTKEIKFDFDAY